MNPVLHDATFRKLRDFIYDKSGIFVPDTKKYLIEGRLARRLQIRNLSSYEDYLLYVTYDSADELARLFDAVTTNETYFFREPQQLEVFIREIVPRVFKLNGTKNLRIWSAACSTGDEPYNLAMLMKENRPDCRFEVLGTDISEAALTSAKKAVFTSYSVRNVPEVFKRKYFESNGSGFELSDAVRSSVVFRKMNLVDERMMRAVRGMDVIFCRNVLIYFDDRAKQKAVSLLYDSLNPGGFFFVGSSESLHNVTRAFRPVIVNKVVVYQKV